MKNTNSRPNISVICPPARMQISDGYFSFITSYSGYHITRADLISLRRNLRLDYLCSNDERISDGIMSRILTYDCREIQSMPVIGGEMITRSLRKSPLRDNKASVNHKHKYSIMKINTPNYLFQATINETKGCLCLSTSKRSYIKL